MLFWLLPYKSFKKDLENIKNSQSELKDTITEMKNILEKLAAY